LAEEPLPARTSKTITSRSGLEQEFQRIRLNGYAVDDEEYTTGVACVSAPIREEGVVVAAYTVSAPVHRFNESREQLVSNVMSFAGRASS
jgi:IclR family acetate operon transcriptional repressor